MIKNNQFFMNTSVALLFLDNLKMKLFKLIKDLLQCCYVEDQSKNMNKNLLILKFLTQLIKCIKFLKNKFNFKSIIYWYWS